MIYADLARLRARLGPARRPFEDAEQPFEYVRRAEEDGHVYFLFRLPKRNCVIRLRVEAEETTTDDRQLMLPLFPNGEAAEPPTPPRRHWSQLDDILLSPDAVGFDIILRQVYSLISPLRRKRHLDPDMGSQVYGEMVIRVCQELYKLEIPIARRIDPPTVCRMPEDQWKLLPKPLGSPL